MEGGFWWCGIGGGEGTRKRRGEGIIGDVNSLFLPRWRRWSELLCRRGWKWMVVIINNGDIVLSGVRVGYDCCG